MSNQRKNKTARCAIKKEDIQKNPDEHIDSGFSPAFHPIAREEINVRIIPPTKKATAGANNRSSIISIKQQKIQMNHHPWRFRKCF